MAEDRYIVAHPNSLVTCTLTDARARADFFREHRSVKIYQLIEIEHQFPRQPKRMG